MFFWERVAGQDMLMVFVSLFIIYGTERSVLLVKSRKEVHQISLMHLFVFEQPLLVFTSEMLRVG